ncbi:MAG: DUF1015 family protein [Carbonactinosporaceae bacterium]
MTPAYARGLGSRAPGPSAGLVLEPFRGLRFDAGSVPDLAAVTTPPYDVIEADGVAQLESAHPYNVVRLILPRTDSPDRTGSTERYRQAARTLRAWRRDGTLVRDPTPALYVYEQRTPGALQRGLLGALGLHPPEDRIVLPHEDVMPGLVADRLGLMRATQANLDPILLAYEGGGDASRIVDQVATRQPLLETTTDDDVTHRLWSVTDAGQLAAIAADLDPRQAMIADGHHRYATYLRLQDEHRATGDGPGPWDYGLALLVDSAHYPLEVRAIHRVVPGLRPADALALTGQAFRIRALTGDVDQGLAALGAQARRGPALMVYGQAGEQDACWLLSDPDGRLMEASMPREHSRTWRLLSPAVLHHVLLDALWQVPDTPQHVTYHHDAVAALRHADQTAGTAVLLTAVAEETVRELAAAGERMPRKSTSFGPKPRTGFVLRTLA